MPKHPGSGRQKFKRGVATVTEQLEHLDKDHKNILELMVRDKMPKKAIESKITSYNERREDLLKRLEELTA